MGEWGNGGPGGNGETGKIGEKRGKRGNGDGGGGTSPQNYPIPVFPKWGGEVLANGMRMGEAISIPISPLAILIITYMFYLN